MKVFCDLDGTLIDVAPRHYKVYKEAVMKYGGVALDKTVYWEAKRRKAKWEELLPMSHLPVEIKEDFLKHFINTIESTEYLAIDQLFPGAHETLLSLKRQHDLYLVSLRRNESNLLWELDNLGLRTIFSRILSGHSETDGYDKKIELISTVKGDARGVIIGDTEADIVTGKQLGLQTIAVTSGIRDEHYLEALSPDYLLKGINELRELDIL